MSSQEVVKTIFMSFILNFIFWISIQFLTFPNCLNSSKIVSNHSLTGLYRLLQKQKSCWIACYKYSKYNWRAWKLVIFIHFTGWQIIRFLFTRSMLNSKCICMRVSACKLFRFDTCNNHLTKKLTQNCRNILWFIIFWRSFTI